DVVEEQREQVARLIGAGRDQVVFVSSGAEANNVAVKGMVLAGKNKGKRHILVSAIEHHSVLNSARFVERFLDTEVTFLPVDADGLVDPERLGNAISPETTLVSIMHGNNEVGTIQPIAELAAVCHSKGVPFHTDAVATVGSVPVNVEALGVDLLTLSGPAFGGPKGTGALYFREKTRLVPLIHGGIQESGRRAGTENIPGIVGMGKAAELARLELDQRANHVRVLRDLLVSEIKENISDVIHTGHPENRLPGHASFCFEAIEGEALLFMLSREGIYASTGSACASKALKTSPVLVALGLPPDLAQGSVVFTLSHSNTQEDIRYVLDKLPYAVAKLRSFSPVWRKKMAA
ncbi:MAG TPA: cysteine desulfurase NifS, partial [Syntrophobacteraceae bacterium]|nr:cysteine desulfurase NifS [Syntrophobacteraceae bacterium]